MTVSELEMFCKNPSDDVLTFLGRSFLWLILLSLTHYSSFLL